MGKDAITNQFLFYGSDDGKITVQVVLDSQQETIWTSQKGLSEIFGVEVPAISKHLKNIFEVGELVESAVVSKMETTASDGKKYDVNFYNLDAIIAVGYRVNSMQATRFRIWATSILRDYLIKGFTLDDDRLKQGNRLFGKDYFQELIERIREIRASERMFYEKITDLYKDCSIDYDKASPITIQFYANVQNKFHYAIHQHTSAELIKLRADHQKPYMGLTSYKNSKTGGKVLKTDVVIAKNYLTENELKALNRLVTMFLDYAESLAEKRVVLSMNDWAVKLDRFLQFNEYPLLSKFGSVSSEVAKRFAEKEFAKFRVIQDKEYVSDFNKFVSGVSSGDLQKESIVNKSKLLGKK